MSDEVKFANVYLEFERTIILEINSKLVDTGLKKDWYSLHSIDIDLIESEVEITGFDKMKGEEFLITYNYRDGKGKIHYLDGHIKLFTT